MQRHAAGMPHQKQHMVLIKSAMSLLSHRSERYRNLCRPAVRHNHDALSTDGKPVTFDVMSVREFLIYTV